eukprot:scaffold111755_cov13-Tisochrysis_lutea.AAC.1
MEHQEMGEMEATRGNVAQSGGSENGVNAMSLLRQRGSALGLSRGRLCWDLVCAEVLVQTCLSCGFCDESSLMTVCGVGAALRALIEALDAFGSGQSSCLEH